MPLKKKPLPIPNPENSGHSRLRKFLEELACIILMTACVAIPSAYAKGHRSTYAQGVKRDSHGHIARSESAKKQFEKQTGYPNGRPGYVVDHIVPLKKGGADVPYNMQWQTKAEAKAKDRWE